MRVGVTGASGFVGRRLVRDLVTRGFEVRAISRKPITELPAMARWAPSPDLSGDSDWSEAIAGLDSVVHTAARVHVMHETAKDSLAAFRRANVDGTLALARQASTAGCKRFIFVSSIKVNGEITAPGRPFIASDEPRPTDPYGISKFEAEQGLFTLAGDTGMEVVVIRPVLIYGPGVKANFRAIMSAVARGLPLPLASVRNMRSLVFVGNLTDLIIRALDHPAAPGTVLLASDGEDLSTAELVRALGGALGRRARLFSLPRAVVELAAGLFGKGAVAQRLLGSLTVDITPTCAGLAWTPPFSVAEGLAETAEEFLGSECMK